MNLKKILCVIGMLLLPIMNYACVKTTPDSTFIEEAEWSGYWGTMEGYEYYHTDDRDLAWEEDILYMAETFLTNYPVLSDNDYRTITYHGSYDGREVVYSNEMYDEGQRQDFMERINLLIPEISKWNDTEIVYEIQKVIATLSDGHSRLSLVSDDFLPVRLEAFYEDGDFTFYAKKVPADKEEILTGKLVSINDVPVDEIVDRLIPYISHECEAGAIFQIVNDARLLTRKTILQMIGVMEADSDEAIFRFETTTGLVNCSLNAVTQEEYNQMEHVERSMTTSEFMAYRYLGEKKYWYEIIETNILYIRLLSMYQDNNQSWDDFFVKIGIELRDAEMPMKVIVDFRGNSGGDHEYLENFAGLINRFENDGVYILVNEESASAAVLSPSLIASSIPGAVVVGSPTAQTLNMFTDAEKYTMPNSGIRFEVPTQYIRTVSDQENAPLIPDIIIYQTPEDYWNGIDTVLEYMLERN